MSAPIALAGVKASSRTTLGAIVAAGFDPDKIIAGFNASPSGEALIGKLNADAAGVDWSDELTRFVVGRIVAAGGDVTAPVAALLVGLSARSTTLLGGDTITAEQCQADWAAGLSAEAAEAAANAIAAVKAQKQGALAEANDECIRLIRDTDDATQAGVLAAFMERLDETWPVGA